MGATTKVKLSTDRACMGDEFEALKQVLGGSGSQVMSKSEIFDLNRELKVTPSSRRILVDNFKTIGFQIVKSQTFLLLNYWRWAVIPQSRSISNHELSIAH